ncbi:MAG TPA: SAM-dependent methyltransferase [Xanthomonadaceae bacterium]|nr:SAM-dependent methyltransferase [Xanthomonadaceae bacterium]
MSSPADALPNAASAGSFDRWLRARLLDRLAGLRHGTLVISDVLGDVRLGVSDPPPGAPVVRLQVREMETYARIASGGSVGAAEAYMDGQWQCDDLVGLVRLLVLNRDLLDAMEGGLARFSGALLKAVHALRRNTRSGSRRNIAAHYDLGNALFKLFLCDNLMYSSAIFASPAESLEAASFRKLERIARKLDLKPSDHLVEIGTGWGGMALHAAQRYGCRVTTTTISKEQHALASERVASAGLADRVTVLLEDYRDLSGHYDKLVSIEMIEAIGHQYLDTYLGKCASLLKPDGLALVQAITIEDHRYQRALGDIDFIKRHVFPGSFIPSISAIASAMARRTDLRLVSQEDFGTSYALTLRHWRERFMARLPEVRALGYDERFLRMWEFYLAYCEGGFLERSIGVSQLLFARPLNRREAWLPEPEAA